MFYRLLIGLGAIALGVALSAGKAWAVPFTVIGPGGVAHTYSELNVDFQAFEVRLTGSSVFSPVSLNGNPLIIDLLTLTDTSRFFAVGNLPEGVYDEFHMMIDITTPNLVESGTGILSPLRASGSSLLIRMIPPISFSRTAPTSLSWVGPLVIFDDTRGTFSLVPALVMTTIPEPETYAMLLAGLGALGFAAHGKKVKARPEARSSPQAPASAPMRDVTERPLPRLRG